MSQKSHQRPSALYSVFASGASLKGVGPNTAKALARNCKSPNEEDVRIKDILFQLPRTLLHRKSITNISEASPDDIVTVPLTIGLHVEAPPRTSRPYRVNAMDASGELVHLIWFKGDKNYLRGLAPEGEHRFVSGKLELNRGVWTIAHADFIVPENRQNEIPKHEAIYPLSSGITNRLMRKVAGQALDLCPDLPEWIDARLLQERGWKSWKQSLQMAHEAKSEADILPLGAVRERLAYDEFLAHHLTLLILRAFMKKRVGQSVVGDKSLTEPLIENLPFRLTESQKKAFAEITEDMESDAMMMRLLQGDVGSGKTIVALLAMLVAVESGGQAALMAPTEILAQQHFQTISTLLEGLGIRVDFLSGRHKGKVRAEILQNLRGSATKIIIGTHALFQSDVEFSDLKLAVIDEQHRFGVEQRMSLLSKGDSPDFLAMTATPIPRTLEMVMYGDLDSSKLTEKPAGFKSAVTSVVSLNRVAEVLEHLEKPLSEGEQIYWVCPLVEESEKLDLATVEARHGELAKIFGEEQVGILHGKLKVREKDRIMADFKDGKIKILIATTVIEVGIDIASANIMIVEQAERFGLAQLHQLRGRIGRGTKDAFCVLLYGSGLSNIARERLGVLRESHDGFVIAEKDLELRKSGEVLGLRQSGVPQFRLADLEFHGDLQEIARSQAEVIVAGDYNLKKPESYPYLVLLHLFESSSAGGYFRSG